MRFVSRQRLLALPVAFAFSAACTLVLPPDESDDDVQRCQNSDECRDLGDNRLLAACFKDDVPAGADGVCVAEYFDLSCDPALFPEVPDGHPFGTAFGDVDASAYQGNCTTLGERGCLPDNGTCASGLEVVQRDINGTTVTYCDDPNAAIKAIPGTISTAGLDVQSNFCRWYFNDNNFVCNLTGSSSGPRCRPCDANADPTAGGCFETWINGAPSSVYVDCPGDGCNDGTKSTAEAVFGPPAEPV